MPRLDKCPKHGFFLENKKSHLSLFNVGPPRMSPKSQRTPRPHRVASCRGGGPSAGDFMSQGPSEGSAQPAARGSTSVGTWSSVVSAGGKSWF